MPATGDGKYSLTSLFNGRMAVGMMVSPRTVDVSPTNWKLAASIGVGRSTTSPGWTERRRTELCASCSVEQSCTPSRLAQIFHDAAEVVRFSAVDWVGDAAGGFGHAGDPVAAGWAGPRQSRDLGRVVG